MQCKIRIIKSQLKIKCKNLIFQKNRIKGKVIEINKRTMVCKRQLARAKENLIKCNKVLKNNPIRKI